MPETLRLSQQGLRVLRVFLQAFSENVRSELVGAELMKSARVSSGTLYPLLLRLEKVGVLASRWEDGRPEDLGRPRRRFYTITPAGVQVAHDALRELGSPLGDVVPSES
jgi:DNA-binding PadR family transcriptional regulator